MPFWGKAQQIYFQTYSLQEGLSQSQVYDLTNDSYGYLWIATNGGGFQRFDGQNFKNYTTKEGLESNFARKVCPDKEGNVWLIDGSAKLYRVCGNNLDKMELPEGFSEDQITAITSSPDGKIWLGVSAKGLVCWDGSVFQTYSLLPGRPSQAITSLYFPSPDSGWVGTVEGLFFFNGVTFQPKKLSDDSQLRITTIQEDWKGHYWLGTTTGLLKWKPGSLEKPVEIPELTGLDITALIEDKDRNMWVATPEGVYVFDFTGESYRLITEENGLPTSSVTSLNQDREGNIWIGTNGGGLAKEVGKSFVHFTRRNGLHGRIVLGIHQTASGVMHVGTEEGLYEIEGSKVRHTPLPEPFSRSLIYCISEDQNGTIWYGTQVGLYGSNGQRFESFPNYPDNDKPRHLAFHVDEQNRLWIGTRRGLWRLENGKLTDLNPEFNTGYNQVKHFLKDPNGNLWIAVSGYGVINYTGDSIIAYNAEDGLIDDRVASLARDKNGNLWVGTFHGLSCFDGTRFTNYTEENGLNSNLLYSVINGPNGKLWMGTDKGLDCFTLNEKSQPVKIDHFGPEEGFIGYETNQNSAFLDKDNYLWFGTIEGITRCDPKVPKALSYPPMLVLNEVRLFREPTDWTALCDSLEPKFGLPVGLELPYNQNSLTFNYSGIRLTYPHKVAFSYQLSGLEEDWSPPDPSFSVTYPNIPPGDYVFRLKTFLIDTPEEYATTEFRFSITQPFWQTLWFRILVGILMALIAYAMVVWRIRSVRKRNNRLEVEVEKRTHQLQVETQTVQDQKQELEIAYEKIQAQKSKVEAAARIKSEFLATMSHEIRTPMNGVIGMTDLLMQTQLDPLQRKYLDKVKLSGEALLSIVNDILDFSKIEAGRMIIEKEPFDLERTIEEIVEIMALTAYKKGLELIFELAPELPPAIISDRSRLKQILINLVGNAIKFTARGEIVIRAFPDPDKPGFVRISVKDTGIGIPEDRRDSLFDAFTQVDSSTSRRYGGTGLGLSITSRLVRLMGGEIFVESELKKGTDFYFHLPIGEGVEKVEKELPKLKIHKVGVCLKNELHQTTIIQYLERQGATCRIIKNVEDLNKALRSPHNQETSLTDWIVEEEWMETAPKWKNRFEAALSERLDLHVLWVNNPVKPGFNLPKFKAQIEQAVKPLTRKVLLDFLTRTPGKPLPSTTLAASEATSTTSQPDSVAQPQFLKTPPKKPSTPAKNYNSLRIMVAEDNEINQAVMVGMFNRMGIKPLIAENGRVAIEMLEENPVDLILMDMQMPEMDGLEATRIIVERWKENRPRIVALTANVMPEDRERCMEAGMDGFLFKPIKQEQIEAVLKEMVS